MLQTIEQSHVKSIHYASPLTTALSSPNSPSSTSSLHAVRPTMTTPQHNHILIVTGPAGCGKSTVAKYLSDRYGFEYIEGDEFHSQANIDKMNAGHPLNDEDRWDWLITLRDMAIQALKNNAKGVVVTCSALKKKYRDVIRTARLYNEDANASIHFIYLRADKETLLARVQARTGHYMKDNMVESQFATLEEPDEAECKQLKDVEVIDVTGTSEDVEVLTTTAVDKVLSGES